MSVWLDMLDLFDKTIGVEAWVSEDTGGKVTYAASAPMACHIKDEVKSWKWEDGNELQSHRTIYVDGDVGKKDRLTLPAGFEPRVVFAIIANRHFGVDGTLHHTQLYT